MLTFLSMPACFHSRSAALQWYPLSQVTCVNCHVIKQISVCHTFTFAITSDRCARKQLRVCVPHCDAGSGSLCPNAVHMYVHVGYTLCICTRWIHIVHMYTLDTHCAYAHLGYALCICTCRICIVHMYTELDIALLKVVVFSCLFDRFQLQSAECSPVLLVFLQSIQHFAYIVYSAILSLLAMRTCHLRML